MEDSTKLTIFNVAGSVFNLEPFKEEELASESPSPELETMKLFLPSALSKAMRETNWRFLVEKINLGEDLGPAGGYTHSFELPAGLFRICFSKTCGYELSKRVVLSYGIPELYGIMSDPDEDGIPDDFWYLVGYALAFFVSNKISPGDSKTQMAMNSYNTILLSMLQNEAYNYSESRNFYGGPDY